MKFHMKDWKKVADHPDHVVMSNKDGHELKISKKALSPKLRDHMQSLPINKADGGDSNSPGIPGGSGSPAYDGPKSDDAVNKTTVSKEVGDQINNLKSYFDQGGLVDLAGKLAPLILAASKGGQVQHLFGGKQVKDESGYPVSTPEQQNNIPGGPGSPDFNPTGAIDGTQPQNKAKGGKIRKYADGTPDQPIQADNSQDSPDQIASDAAPSVNVNVGTPPASAQDQEMAARYGSPQMGEAPMQLQAPTPSAQGPYDIPTPEQDPTGVGAAYATMFNQRPVTAPGANAQQQGQPQGNANPPVKDVAPPQNSNQDQMSGYAQSAIGGANQEMAGYAGQAASAKQLGAAVETLATQAAESSSKAAQNFIDTQKAVQMHEMEIYNAYKDGTIQPRHIFDNMNTGQRLLAGLGLMFTSAGSALAHRADSGMEYVNNLMDADLKAQQANQGNRLNMFNHFNEVFKNNADAALMTRTLQNDYVDHLIDAAKAKNMDPTAQAQMNIQQGQLRQRTAMLRSMIGTNGGPGGTMDKIPQTIQMYRMIGRKDLADDMQSKYVPEAPGQVAQVPVDEATRNEIASRKLLDDNITQLQQFSAKYGGTLQGMADPRVKAQGEALARQVQDQYRRGNQQGVFKPAEAEFVNGVIADNPSSLFAKFTKAPAYQAAKGINQGALAAQFSKVGLRPLKVGNMAPASTFVPKTQKPIGQ